MRVKTLFHMVLLTTGIMMARPVFAVDDFYQVQLRLGSDFFAAGKYDDSIDAFRIACFGFLDRPQLLTEGLARLAVAQSAAGKSADLGKTLERFVQIEQRFAAYRNTALDDGTKKAFEALLLKALSPEQRAAVPALATIGPSRLEQISQLAPRERRKALEAEAAKNPKSAAWQVELARDAKKRNDVRGTLLYASRALELDSSNADAILLRAHARFVTKDYKGAFADFGSVDEERIAGDTALTAERFIAAVRAGEVAAAQQLLPTLSKEVAAQPEVVRAAAKINPVQQKTSSKPPEAAPATPAPSVKTDKPSNSGSKESQDRAANPYSFSTSSQHAAPPPDEDVLSKSAKLVQRGRPADAQKLLYGALKTDPNRRDVRLAFLEASCLARDWKTASAQVPLVQPFVDGEEPYMYYAALSYFETGRKEDSKALLRRALPGLTRDGRVEKNVKRILGSGD